MADNTLESQGKVLPKDLVITSQPDTVDKDKFKVVSTGLKIDTQYAFQFQYVFEDGEVSEWSPGFSVNTGTESVPSAPSATIPSTSIGSIPVTLNSFPTNAKRVDIYIIGGEFGIGKIADYFLSAGTKSIAVSGGVYQVSLITVTPSGINGDPTNTFTITVSTAGETVEAPTNPNGFSIVRVLGGIEVVWAGTYANGTFTGFEAIKIYVGNSATATVGTFVDAGVMTGNNVRNSIIVPVDGTYLRYDQPVYIHARAVNKDGTEGILQVNVANNSLGARSAVSSDLADAIITNAKLVDDAVTAAKIATNAITETKIANDAITTPKLVANAITADKIVSSAITADKIATNAVTATKILAGTIDVTKLAAGTISVNNLEAGTIAATSFIRAGSTSGGARIEMSSANISGGPSAGFYIYNSFGQAVLEAPLSGGLVVKGDITGSSGTFSGALSIGSNFSVTSTGILTAAAGTIGGWAINSTQIRSNSANQISLNPATPKIALIQGATLNGTTGLYEGGTEKITIDPVEGIKSTGASGSFTLSPNGILTATGANFSGEIKATTGYIGGTTSGWQINSGTLTGGTLTLNSSGSLVTTGTVVGWSTSGVPVTGTVSGGLFSSYTNESSEGYLAGYGSSSQGIRAYNNSNNTYVTANGIRFESNASSTYGTSAGGFRIQNVAGDYDVLFDLYGMTDGSGYTGRSIRFIHWQSGSGQRNKDNIVRTFDTAQSGVRTVKVYTDGRMYLGETQYFSTTQTSTPSAGIGENGDLFFSTA